MSSRRKFTAHSELVEKYSLHQNLFNSLGRFVSFITNTHIQVKNQFSIYLSLTSQEQLVLRTLAICFEPIGQTVFRKILASLSTNLAFTELCKGYKLGTKFDKIFSPSFRDLLEKHKLIKLNNKGVRLSTYLCHALSMQCIKEKSLAIIIEEINNVSPIETISSWGRIEQHFLSRYVHNHFYSGNFGLLKTLIKFNKNPQVINLNDHEYLLSFCFYPFSESLFLTLPSQWQYQLFALLFKKQHLDLQDTTETVALLFDLNKRGYCDSDLQLLLAEQLLLTSDINNAEKILLPLSELLSAKADVSVFAYLQALLAWLFFLQEDFHQALNYFERHKQAKNKLARRKRQYVSGFPGIVYFFTLFKLGLEENNHYLTQAIEQEFNYSTDNANSGDEAFSYRTLSSFARVLDDDSNQMTKVHTGFAYTNNELDLHLNLLFSALCHSWLGITPFDDYLASLHKSFKCWQQANQGWFSQISAQLLLKYGTGSLTGDKKAQQFYQDFLVQSPATIELVNLIKQKESWLSALDKLISLDKPKSDENSPLAEVTNESRIIWLVATLGDHKVEPREQKRNKNGWTKGRLVALERLYNSQDEFPYLTVADKKICQAIDVYSDSYHWRPKDVFELSGYSALKSCVGHPLLFLNNDERTSLDIIEKTPELLISESSKGYKITMEDIPKYVDFTEDFYHFKPETASRYSLTFFLGKHVDIAKIVGRKGLNIPKAAKNKVIDSIKAIAPLLNIQTNIDGIEDIDTGIEQVMLDQTLYINIEPSGEGLQFECHIQPLGEQGPILLPGVGSEMVVGQVDGKRVGTQRKLSKEKKDFKALVNACPMFNYMSEHVLVLDDLEDALSCLQQLETLSQQLDSSITEVQNKKDFNIVLQWPQGQSLKVSKTLSSQQMQVSITKKQDWFDLVGELNIDENEVLDIKKLISLVGEAKGRFIQLSDDHFVALTEELKKKLVLLDKASHNGHFDPLASPVIDDALSGMTVKSDKAWQQQMKKLAQSYQLSPQVPATLQAQLRDYQLAGYDWASRLSHWGAGACLADDMGLGKTLQALAIIVERASQGPTLVLAPTSVSFNWQDEANKFSPTLNVKLYGMHNSKDRQHILDNAQAFDLIICSYGLLQTQGEKLAKITWQTLIADEAQALKNPQTKRSKIANTLTANFKMITTGTPIENNLTELWSLFRFINPRLLGSLKQFTERFVKPIESASFQSDRSIQGNEHSQKNSEANEASEALRQIIAPFMLRRLKTDVLTELPSRTEVNIHVELSKEEMALYEAIRQKAIENLLSTDDKPGQKRIKVLAEIMRLRRACCHPKLVFPESELTGAKLQAFDNLVNELKQGDHKALVFSQFVGHLQLLKQHLVAKGVRFQYLDGSTTLAKRKKAVTDFQAGEGDLFLISLKAGGAGLNLTAADYVIHMDPWWNPAVEDQASDRAHRMGQKRPVTIYRLITQHTIEDKIVALHQQKRNLANSLLEGTDNAKAISLDDMMNLLKDEQ